MATQVLGRIAGHRDDALAQLESEVSVLHVASAIETPQLPRRRWTLAVQGVISSVAHFAAAWLIVTALAVPAGPGLLPVREPAAPARVDTSRMVFIAGAPLRSGGGGGGGGNRQAGPIRHAEGVGSDAMTLRVAAPISTARIVTDVAPLPAVALDAKPLASGTYDQIGLPVGGVGYGTSTGPGSGGGVGSGVGTGIGSGTGPGIGPGSGGGMGGGAYRAGGLVSAPRVIVEVSPTYTNDALLEKVQGTVVLELVVTRDGTPAHIRVIRPLDPGLDQQAIRAAAQWRFDPGRLAGQPVDVLVTLMLDFRIR